MDTVAAAGLFEVCWPVGLKYTDGFKALGPSLFVFVTLAISMWLLSVAARALPIGTAYAIWVGIGAVGAAPCSSASRLPPRAFSSAGC